MITPLDIQNKEFKKAFRGYKESEVDQFLDDIIDDYESLYKENLELKDKILVLSEQIKQYNNLEETLKDTLIVAQSTADEVTSSARHKAQLIVEDAEMTAKKLIDAADDEVRNIRKEYEYLKKEIFIFKTRYQSFIEAQLITLDEFYAKIEGHDINISSHEDTGDYIKDSEETDLESQDINLERSVDDLGA
ncbi:MAG: DivIVA domain-containing protein [Tissierellia bacterium]|nr:DivIVA domain-containing protein [Tissierellia bacterium]